MIDYVFLPAPRTPQRKSLQFGGCRIDFRLRLLSTYRANKKTFFVGFHCNCLLLAVYYFFTGKFPIGEWPVFRYPLWGCFMGVLYISPGRVQASPVFPPPRGWVSRNQSNKPDHLTSPCGGSSPQRGQPVRPVLIHYNGTKSTGDTQSIDYCPKS